MTRIAVAALTCRRPRMLAALLASFEQLAMPPAAEVFFLIVDNAPDAPAAGQVRDWARRTGLAAHHVVEPEAGIPFARNRALDEARSRGADLLAFVDDDETVDPAWLAELVEQKRRDGSELVGGPVRCAAEPPPSWRARLVLAGLRDGYRRRERRNARRRRAGRDGDVVLVTNNWLGDLDWIGARGLRFDTGLRFTGGSDTAFYHRAKSLGARTSWCPTAVVVETIPAERLSLAYQFRRARDQATTNYLRKPPDRRRGLAAVLGGVAGKMVLGGLLVAAAPLTAGRSAVAGFRSLGAGVGHLKALAGRRSRHYESVTGQ